MKEKEMYEMLLREEEDLDERDRKYLAWWDEFRKNDNWAEVKD